MVFRKKTFRARRKRTYGRRPARKNFRKRFNRRTRSIVKSTLISNDSYWCKMNLSNFGKLTGVSPAHQVNICGNSVFDPFVLGSGLMTGASQLYNVYEQARVHSSRLSLQVSQLPSTADPVMISMFPTTDSAAITSGFYNQPYVKRKLLPTVGGPTVFLKDYMTTRKIFDAKDITDYPGYSADSSHNPGSLWYWQVYMESADSSVDINIAFYFEITVYVEFYQRVSLN